MKYVVLFKRGERIPNLDEWFDDRSDAERRCEELQGMFDWLYERTNRASDKCTVWIECAELN